AGSYSDQIELRSNLLTIADPHEVASGGGERVRFVYGSSGDDRDHVKSQQWGTGESATFTYNGPTSTIVRDVLGQSREYTLTAAPKDYVSDRPHVTKLVEKAVATSSAGFGVLPSSITASEPNRGNPDRTYTFSYDAEGQVTTASLDGVRTMTYTYNNVQPEAAGFVPSTAETTSQGGSSDTIKQTVHYQSGANSQTRPQSYDANGKTINSPEAHRNALAVTAVNDAVTLLGQCNSQGLAKEIRESGGTDTGAQSGKRVSLAAAGTGQTISSEYAPADDSALFRRSMPTRIDRGGLTTSIEYPGEDQVIERDERGIVKTTDYDALRRPLHVNVTGPDLTQDETFQYDASGRLRKSVRKQGGA
ncbi:MAG TPA: hypothetical protein VKJ07_05635, partial [Mycobacteriales bacterium]|nr:hypothetical protein [Mycobacteriales bacterium]